MTCKRVIRILATSCVRGPAVLGLLLATCAFGQSHAKAAQHAYRADWQSLANHQTPEWLRNAKFGIFVHWLPNSVPAFNDEWYARWMYSEGHPVFEHHRKTWGDQGTFGYKDFIPMFKAEKWNPDEWAALFEGVGARFVVPNAEHHCHFAMWDSALTTWDAKDRGPKRDIVGELADAVRKRGMRFGLSNHRARGWNFYTYKPEFDTMNPKFEEFYWPQLGREPDAEWLQDWKARLIEITDKYHPDVMWFDYGWASPAFEPYKKDFVTYYYNKAAKSGQSVTVIYKGDQLPRGVGLLDVERGKLDKLWPELWMTDTSVFETTWGYVKGAKPKSPDTIIDDLIDIVSKNGTLLLNIGPKPDGTIPNDQVAVLNEIGDWLRHNGEAIYETRPFDVAEEGEGVRFTRKGNAVYACFLRRPDPSVVLRELSPKKLGGLEVTRVSLLWNGQELKHRPAEDGLHVTLPDELVGEHAWVVKVELAGVGFGHPTVRVEHRPEGGAVFAHGRVHNFTAEEQTVDARLFINRGAGAVCRVQLPAGESDDVRFQHRDQNHYGARSLLLDNLADGIYDFRLGRKKPESTATLIAFPAVPTIGTWKFREGDSNDWSTVAFDDSDWPNARVPGEWPIGRKEDRTGWFRRRFTIPASWKGRDVSMNLGVIMDADTTYFNGVKIGEKGAAQVEFHFSHETREFTVPADLVKYGEENVVAIRVYSREQKGGLVGPPGHITVVND